MERCREWCPFCWEMVTGGRGRCRLQLDTTVGQCRIEWRICMDTTCQVLLVRLVSRPNHLAFLMHALHIDVA